MPRPGLVGPGFYTSKLLFGGLDGGMATNTVAYSPTYSSNDWIRKTLTVTSSLKTFNNADGTCYKIICSGTLALNSGGAIDCSGGTLNGGPNASSGAANGFVIGGTLGKSGNGGPAQNSTIGGNGEPTAGGSVWLGGAGGNGGTYGSHAGGAGGTPGPTSAPNNIFSSSIYRDAMLYFTTDPEMAGDFPVAYLSSAVCGGGGGGGGGDNAGHSMGGGGCGGGVVYIAADRIEMNGGDIRAGGQSALHDGGSGEGSGGGGGGGVVILVTNEIVWNDTSSYAIDVRGGSGGGNGATDGIGGNILLFSDQLVARFNGHLNKALYNAALLEYQTKYVPPPPPP